MPRGASPGRGRLASRAWTAEVSRGWARTWANRTCAGHGAGSATSRGRRHGHRGPAAGRAPSGRAGSQGYRSVCEGRPWSHRTWGRGAGSVSQTKPPGRPDRLPNEATGGHRRSPNEPNGPIRGTRAERPGSQGRWYSRAVLRSPSDRVVAAARRVNGTRIRHRRGPRLIG